MANLLMAMSTEMKDSLGVTVSDQTFWVVPDSVTLANLDTWAALYLPLVDAITGSQITKNTYKVIGTLPGTIKVTPTTDEDNERTGLFNFARDGSTHKWGVDISGITASVIVAGKIDPTNTDVADFAAFLTTVTSTIRPVSSEQQDLTTWLDALITFRKHRKAESRRSLVTL